MSIQTPIRVEDALKRVHHHDYVLPAIQREFVWRPEQIERLFDSLMQGYPIGSFLFWSVQREQVGQYKFYDFVRDYHQKLRPHCPPLEIPPGQPVTAVLDGQQRITALNIGLMGSHAQKEPRRWWTSPDAFPEKVLYVNIADLAEENEGGWRYDFRFLASDRATHTEGQHWFRVGQILEMTDAPELFEYVQDAGLATNRHAFKILNRLHAVIRRDPTISYFLEESQDLDKVLNIFIRTNSGGTVLSYSDLLLSIATAQWSSIDARKTIHDLVDELNSTRSGFTLSKDFVLKAGLMLADIGSVGFKVTNFNRENMAILENRWGAIAQALRLTVRLAGNFGFSGQTLSADNALLPIAYWLYKTERSSSYLASKAYVTEHKAIHRWLIRSLLKSGVWGSGLDTLLTAIRETLRESSSDVFPVDAIESTMRARGKSLRFENEELEDLVDTSYGDRRAFPLLALLFPMLDLRNQFHVDHFFPRSRFTMRRLAKEGVPPELRSEWFGLVDRLPNLQLLDGTQNIEKSAMLPHEWLASMETQPGRREEYVSRHQLGAVPEDLHGFGEFYAARRTWMLERLRGLLGDEATPEA